MALRYLIVDDEAPSRVNLRLAMAEHTGWLLAAECDSAAQARSALAAPDIDLIFLDIQMPGEGGIALARELCRLPEPPLIVFVTAYSEHAVDAFEVYALDYLLKPLNDARLAQAIERAAAMLAQRQRSAYAAALRDYTDRHSTVLEHLHVRSVGRIEQVRIADIEWIGAAGNYVELHLSGRTVLHRITVSRLEALLPAQDFVRVHRGAIVRRSQIARLEGGGDSWRLVLRCGAAVPVSERHVGALKALM